LGFLEAGGGRLDSSELGGDQHSSSSYSTAGAREAYRGYRRINEWE